MNNRSNIRRHLEPAAVDGGPGGGGCRHSAAPASAAPSFYFKDSNNTVDDRFCRQKVGQCLVVKSVGCRSRFCERCCRSLGFTLRDRLIRVLSTFHSVYMVSLTVDPSLFRNDPLVAYGYLRDKRCVSEFVRELRKAGVLSSDRYFYVVEWQKDTEFPHFHLVLDAEFIPFDLLCSAWGKFRPKDAGPVEGNRPAFGSVQFTKKWSRGSAERAGNYVGKYLTKHPAHGYPDWVLDAKFRIRRFSTSRGFWGGFEAPRDDESWAGREDVSAVEVEEGEHQWDKEDVITIRERVDGCGAMCAVFERIEYADENGELSYEDRWFGLIAKDIVSVARLSIGAAVDGKSLVFRGAVEQMSVTELLVSVRRSSENNKHSVDTIDC